MKNAGFKAKFAAFLTGLAIAGGVGGGKILKGLQVAGVMVHAVKEGSFFGGAVSPFNYIRGSQAAVTIGLVNIIRDNPAGLKVLPIFNTSF